MMMMIIIHVFTTTSNKHFDSTQSRFYDPAHESNTNRKAGCMSSTWHSLLTVIKRMTPRFERKLHTSTFWKLSQIVFRIIETNVRMIPALAHRSHFWTQRPELLLLRNRRAPKGKTEDENMWPHLATVATRNAAACSSSYPPLVASTAETEFKVYERRKTSSILVIKNSDTSCRESGFCGLTQSLQTSSLESNEPG
jgi:hypothetical protein